MVLDETFLEFLYRMKKSVNAERNRLALWGPRGSLATWGSTQIQSDHFNKAALGPGSPSAG